MVSRVLNILNIREFVYTNQVYLDYDEYTLFEFTFELIRFLALNICKQSLKTQTNKQAKKTH